MHSGIRIVAGIGLAGVVAMALPLRADETPAKPDPQAQLDDLRAQMNGMAAKISELKAPGSLVQIHGFAETDVYNDTVGGLTESVGNSAVKLFQPSGQHFLNDNGMTQTSIRNSRIDFLAENETGAWKSKGYLEFDLLGYDPSPLYGAPTATGNAAPSNSEANFYTAATLRVRHAYLETRNGGLDILAGQYWSLLGWNTEYMLNTVSVAPVMGELYQRTPQVRVAYTVGDKGNLKAQIAADVERPSQRESDQLNYTQAARILFGGWTSQIASAVGAVRTVPLSLGIGGTERKYAWDGSGALGADSYSVWGQGLALDAMAPVLPFDGKNSCSAVITGEWTAGTGYGDEFPTWSGGASALSAATGVPDLDQGIGMLDPKYKNGQGNPEFTLVKLSSWNTQFQFHLPPSLGTFFTVGYGQLSSPNVSDLTEGTSNFGSVYDLDSAIFANVMQDFGTSVRVALEYDSFFTHYAGNNSSQEGEGARDNRLQLSSWYRF